MPIIVNTKESVNRISGRFLAPGPNEVSEREMEVLSRNRHFRAQVELGLLEVVKELPEETPSGHLNLGTAQPPAAKAEEALSAKDMITLVEKSKDIDQLKAWLKSEARTTVKRAIEKRLSALDAQSDGKEE